MLGTAGQGSHGGTACGSRTSTRTAIGQSLGYHRGRSAAGLPGRLLTAFEVAAFIGCHEETIRRAYWPGLLCSQRFGVGRRRLHPDDVLDWLRRGALTKPL